MLRSLNRERQEEVVLELRSHLLESMRSVSSEREAERLLTAIERLGPPEDYLRPIVADQLLEQGARSFDPVAIGRGLALNLLGGIRNGILAIVFGVGYLAAGFFVLMAVMKVFVPERIGLFKHADGGMSFGLPATTAGATELLGYWTVPLALAVGLLLYTGLTKLLVLLNSRTP